MPTEWGIRSGEPASREAAGADGAVWRSAITLAARVIFGGGAKRLVRSGAMAETPGGEILVYEAPDGGVRVDGGSTKTRSG